MTKTFSKKLIGSTLLLTVLLLHNKSQAHDLKGLVDEETNTSSSVKAVFAEIDKTRALLAGRSSGDTKAEGLEGLIQRSLVWKKSAISVCFMDGDPKAWQQIKQIADQWTEGLSTSFDFGEGSIRKCSVQKHSDIRVTFRRAGYWSYVGIKAKYIKEKQPTLGLANMGSGNTLTKDQAATVLHEFGHALGLEHEHQTTKADCESQFDWDYLHKFLGAQGWDKQKVDFNMRKLSQANDIGGLYATEFDRASIMLYSLPKQVFLKSGSSCYIPNKNLTISDVDRETISTVYPTAGAAAANAFQEVNASVLQSLQYLEEQTGTDK